MKFDYDHTPTATIIAKYIAVAIGGLSATFLVLSVCGVMG